MRPLYNGLRKKIIYQENTNMTNILMAYYTYREYLGEPISQAEHNQAAIVLAGMITAAFIVGLITDYVNSKK